MGVKRPKVLFKGLQPLHILVYLDCFTVPTVNRSPHFTSAQVQTDMISVQSSVYFHCEIYFLPNLKNSLVTLWTIHGMTSWAAQWINMSHLATERSFFSNTNDLIHHHITGGVKDSGAVITLSLFKVSPVWCFQFFYSASGSAATKTFPSHVTAVWAKPLICGTKNIWVWGNVLDDLDPRSRLWRQLAKICLSAR